MRFPTVVHLLFLAFSTARAATLPANFSETTISGRTRVMLFVTNLDLLPNENSSVVTVQAEDAAHNVYPLTIEFVGKVAGFDWLNQVVVRLPDNLPATQPALLSVALHGQTSNKARVRMN